MRYQQAISLQNNIDNVTILSQRHPTPTPDPTANWQTYINAGHGFSIKRPSDWTISEEYLSETSSTIVKGKQVQIIDIKKNGNAYTGVITIKPEGGNGGFNPLAQKQTGKIGSMVVTDYTMVNNIDQLVDFYRDFGYTRIPGFSIDAIYAKNDADIVNQILSTFKFTQ